MSCAVQHIVPVGFKWRVRKQVKHSPTKRRYGPIVPKTFSAIVLATMREVWVDGSLSRVSSSWWSDEQASDQLLGDRTPDSPDVNAPGRVGAGLNSEELQVTTAHPA